MKNAWVLALVAIGVVTVSFAAETTPATNAVSAADQTNNTTAGRTARLSEGLIYSVDRTPENPFDTPRSVEVITIDDIWRKNGMTLTDVLTEVPGFYLQQSNFSGGAPIIRGQMGKQVLVLIDGVKVNNATWRNASKEYLNIIDLNQVERIEVVRGVVSVLGTESLGGVINVITRKGPMDNNGFGGAVGGRYSSADGGYSVPVQVYGKGDSYRYFAGVTYRSSGDLRGGGDFGRLEGSGSTDKSAYANLQQFLSSEKTVSFGYRNLQQFDINRLQSIADGTNVSFRENPIRLQIATLGYQDLTARAWADAFRATASWNRQDEGRDEVRAKTPTVNNILIDSDRMLTLSLEFGKFFSSHHFVYGVDMSRDSIASTRHDFSIADGQQIGGTLRGRYTDGARYQTAAVYVNDKFDISRWVTTTAGVRYGTFSASGHENTTVGDISIATRTRDFTGAVDMSVHVTPKLNLVANAIRGFRAPNIDDISKYSERRDGIEIPNPNVGPEHVNSYEGGFKYETSRFGASGFYYKNNLKDLLVRVGGTYQGKDYFDLNKNGVRDPKEPSVLLNKNIGESEIRGIELGAHWSPTDSIFLFGSYNNCIGDDKTAGEPLQRIPPIFGNAGIRWSAFGDRRPWVELVYDYAGRQARLSDADRGDPRIGAAGTPSYDVFTVRGGMNLTNRFRLSAGVENITDEAYKYHGSFAFRPGRSFLFGTEYRF